MAKKNVVIKDAQCSESYAESIFSFWRFLVFSDMDDNVLKILCLLETLTTDSATLCKADSETLTSDTQ